MMMMNISSLTLLKKQNGNRARRNLSIGKNVEKRKKQVLGVYSVVPEDLFRVNESFSTKLKTKSEQRKAGKANYDVEVKEEDGLIHPFNGKYYQGPNGASARPNSIITHFVLSQYEKAKIYRISKGTKLPEELVLVHEHSNHHSFQPSKPMNLSQFNDSLTHFFKSSGELMTKKQFLSRYPFEQAFELDAQKVIHDLNLGNQNPSSSSSSPTVTTSTTQL
eukprot:TRINITY_DN6393_c0_g1_i2.p1 TRINITY_DN6393_c0_g1~~TRINITY_DN6393_c0_g1_i2.p1  ORF type:complete len:220 (-),score=64.40 TRINITY_DN6393_c0_g1_i2:152-811(-)